MALITATMATAVAWPLQSQLELQLQWQLQCELRAQTAISRHLELAFDASWLISSQFTSLRSQMAALGQLGAPKRRRRREQEH